MANSFYFPDKQGDNNNASLQVLLYAAVLDDTLFWFDGRRFVLLCYLYQHLIVSESDLDTFHSK